MRPVAVWNWQSEPVPDARVVIASPGLTVGRAAQVERSRKLVNDASSNGVRFIIPAADPGQFNGLLLPWRAMPALHIQRQSDLAGLDALFAVKAERRALVVSPLESIDVSAWLGYAEHSGRWIGPCGCEAERDPWTRCDDCEARGWSPPQCQGIDLIIICGFESPLNPSHVRSVVEQCRAAGAPCIFAGWGAYLPDGPSNPIEIDGYSKRHRAWLNANCEGPKPIHEGREGIWWTDGTITDWGAMDSDGEYVSTWTGWSDSQTFYRVGAARSGALLDGVEVCEMPDWLGGAE